MLGHGILCIFLHAGVYCSIDFQPVRIKIIFASVLLCILFRTSRTEGLFPSRANPRNTSASASRDSPIYRASWHSAHHAGIHGNTLQDLRYGLRDDRIVSMAMPATNPFLNSDISGFAHLVEHHIAASARTFVITHRIIKGRILAHTHQRWRLPLSSNPSVRNQSIGIGGSLYAHRIIQEVKLIKIHRKNFLFGIIALQLYGYHPLDGLLEQTLHYIVGAWRIKLFGKLLADCTATAGILLHQNTTLHHGTEQRDGINPRMFGKRTSSVAISALIIWGDKSLYPTNTRFSLL